MWILSFPHVINIKNYWDILFFSFFHSKSLKSSSNFTLDNTSQHKKPGELQALKSPVGLMAAVLDSVTLGPGPAAASCSVQTCCQSCHQHPFHQQLQPRSYRRNLSKATFKKVVQSHSFKTYSKIQTLQQNQKYKVRVHPLPIQPSLLKDFSFLFFFF